ncbi:FtsW/RodA/SpoVE family cell cycle protein [Massilia sp. DWR3-1-1]|uniref:FtsW/RodA/SpoVE family cell cycle protein n=1 Tax=Massilia sp. DWR3-1-1 TaxID=2804559 RepID=UPI003CEA7CB9
MRTRLHWHRRWQPGWRGALAVLLALLFALQLLALARSPALAAPERIAISLAPGQRITVGEAELAAPQADRAHLALRRDGAGRWWAANASAGKQLIVRRDGVDQRSGASALAAGQSFQIGAARFSVTAADSASVTLNGPGGPWRYDGARLLRAGVPQIACPDAPLAAHLVAWWNRLAPSALSIGRPLSFGGNLYCGNRLGIAGVEPNAATLAAGRGALLLSGAASVLAAGEAADSGGAELARQEESLDGVSALVAGHTRFAVQQGGAVLELRPLAHVALYGGPAAAAAGAALPPQVLWRWRARALWALPAGPAWTLAAALTAAMLAWLALAWQGGRWPYIVGSSGGSSGGSSAGASALLAIAGLCALQLQRAGTPPGAGVSLLLGGAALASVLLVRGRLQLASAAAVLLLGLGLLAQLDMGLAALESSWLRHYQKSCALLAIGLGVGTHLRLRWRGRPGLLSQGRLEALLALLAGTALCALAAQVAFGDETGVFDLQPVELAKLALCALAAHCLAVGMGWHQALPAYGPALLRWGRLAAPALLFAFLLALALLEVDDYSPLILLLVWTTAMAFAYAVATRSRWAMVAVASVALAAAAAIATLRLAGAGAVASWSFYADRFLVWLDPASHPHTGQQLLQGARAIADGAWWGADGMLGLASLGQGAGAALRIAQVQDDFAPAFFLYRHGLAAGLVLWLLQALFVTGVLQVAARAHAHARAAGDFRQAWLGRFCCFALCGGAAFVLGHLLLSWGTNLAIFPVMGQPMSFLSAGGSHLLFFICPLLAFTAISAQTFEEMQSCRSMSNTKR